jgi:hypothetical protein
MKNIQKEWQPATKPFKKFKNIRIWLCRCVSSWNEVCVFLCNSKDVQFTLCASQTNKQCIY